MKLLIFDTETTSIKPGNICQLSYILIDASSKPQKTIGKNFFFTVEDMDPAAEEIHGFSLEKLYELSNGLYFPNDEYFDDFTILDDEILQDCKVVKCFLITEEQYNKLLFEEE